MFVTENTDPAQQAPAGTQQTTTEVQGPIDTTDAFEGMLNSINPAEPPAVNTEGAPSPEGPKNPDGTISTGTDPQAAPAIGELPKNKQNQVFAQMRVQNRQQSLALQTILQKAGFDPNLAQDPEEVIRLLEDAEVEQQAEDLAVPPELLQRLNYLEKANRASESEKVYQEALTGFQAIQDRFGLDQAQLQNFALQLQQSGVNPFEQPIDLPTEFIKLNFDWVVQRERQIAVQEALAKQGKAYLYSTTPARTQGKPTADPTGDKINTMAQFERVLFDMSK